MSYVSDLGVLLTSSHRTLKLAGELIGLQESKISDPSQFLTIYLMDTLKKKKISPPFFFFLLLFDRCLFFKINLEE